jgi:hypothetical protein
MRRGHPTFPSRLRRRLRSRHRLRCHPRSHLHPSQGRLPNPRMSHRRYLSRRSHLRCHPKSRHRLRCHPRSHLRLRCHPRSHLHPSQSPSHLPNLRMSHRQQTPTRLLRPQTNPHRWTLPKPQTNPHHRSLRRPPHRWTQRHLPKLQTLQTRFRHPPSQSRPRPRRNQIRPRSRFRSPPTSLPKGRHRFRRCQTPVRQVRRRRGGAIRQGRAPWRATGRASLQPASSRAHREPTALGARHEV